MSPIRVLFLLLLPPAFLQEPAENEAEPSPRATIERAAYVEEYERDLELAATLYARAEADARAAGDEKTAAEAGEARRRVQARAAGSPGAVAAQQSDELVARIGELLHGLSRYQPVDSDKWASSVISDLAVYGASTVPWLEELLQPKAVQIGPFLVQLDTRAAARVLARQDSEEASAALARALTARDPLIRRAVAEELDARRHRGLLEQAAGDAVSQVREKAVSKLLGTWDATLLPLVESVALGGDRKAIEWIAWIAPERLLELLETADEGSAFFEVALRELSESNLSATVATADVFLRLGRELPDALGRGLAVEAMRSLFGRGYKWQADESLRLHVQEQLLAQPERYPWPDLFELLATIGDVRAFELLSRELTSWPAEGERLARYTRDLLGRTRAEDFDVLAALYRELPPAPGSPVESLQHDGWHEEVRDRLEELAQASEVDAASLARGYADLSEPLRSAYHDVASEWLRRRNAPEGIETLVPLLRDMLGNPESTSIVSGALRGLRLAGDLPSLPRVVELTTRANVRNEAIRAAYELAALDPDLASTLIEEAIRAERLPHESVKYLPDAQGLALFGRLWPEAELPSAREALLSVLVHELDCPEADARMVELYGEMSQAKTRVGAIQHLGNVLYEPAVPVLGQALEDPERAVRQAARDAFHAFKEHREALEEFAAWTLGDRAARAQIDELVALLASPDREVLLGAIRALGVVRGRAALPELVRLLEREDEALRAAVHEAIERIGR